MKILKKALKLERRGRPRKQSSWGTTRAVIFVIIVTFIAMLANWGAMYLEHNFRMSFVNEVVAKEAKEDRLELLEENSVLKEKLERSSKAQVDDRTKEIVRYYLKEYFKEAAPVAEKVFTCESGLNPNAKNVNGGAHAGSVDRGVAQINDKFHKARFEKMYGVSFEVGAHDIQLNLKYAAYLYHASGNFHLWVCSKVL